MGARTPSTLRPRRGAIKCEYCGRSLASLDALKSHQNTLHAAALKRKIKQRLDAKKVARHPIAKPKLKLSPEKSGKTKKKVLVSKLHRPTKKIVSLNSIAGKTAKKLNSRATVNTAVKPRKVVKESDSKSNNIGKVKPNLKTTDNSAKKPLKLAKVSDSNSTGKPQKPVKESSSKPNNAEKVTKFKKIPIYTKSELKVDTSTSKMEEEATGSSSQLDERQRIEFKCPKCDKSFTMYFRAQKHIQKFHCVNSAGDKVSPDSPDLIEPIQIEHCSSCNESFMGSHDCPHAPKQEPPQSEDLESDTSVPNPFGCIACNVTFVSLSLFQKHVTSMHNDGLESMLFPTIDEFEKWRYKMENQTKTRYTSAGRNNNRNYYQCATNSDPNMVFSCPSLIVYQTYPTGIQVHFYKHHYKHKVKPYNMETYKSYNVKDMITVLAREPTPVRVKKEEMPDDLEELKNDEDLYVRFKTLMENIIMDAAKINIDTLKVLSDKALEMHSVLNQYDEDEDLSVGNTSVLSFNGQHSEHTKRKPDTSITSPLRKKLRTTLRNDTAHKSPILQHTKRPVNSFSLANDKDSDRILQELVERPETKPEPDVNNADASNSQSEPRSKSPKPFNKLLPQFDRSPSAFNDSYKDFVSSVIGKNERKQKLTTRNNIPAKKIKTKMGQFNPNSPKRNQSAQNSSNVEQVGSPRRNFNPNSPKRNQNAQNSSNVEQVGSPRRNFNPNSPKRNQNAQNSSNVGQVGSPRRNTAKGGPKSKRKKVARDFKYEVKERDNDCNILILKI